MRYLFLIIFSALLSTSISAQVDSIDHSNLIFTENQTFSHSILDSESYKKTSEWKKYKILNISGWSALGVGIPITFTGVIGICLDVNDGGKGGPWIPITVTGGVLTLSSIPLLIIANHYKKKALMNNLSVGLVNLETPNYINNLNFTPAISLTLKF